MTESNIVRAYNVRYTDEFLGVDDFRTIRADNEEDALQTFNEEYAEDDRHEVNEVELAYELDQGKIEDLIEGVES